jgi:hypothetical protein
MGKNTSNVQIKKWERKFENEYSITIWKFNSDISLTNPYEVEIKHKPDKRRK